MEKSTMEYGPRPILTKEEVLSEMKRHDENAQFSREKSDVSGQLYFIEFTAEGKEPGETIEYIYLRKGAYPDGNQSGETAIQAFYYSDGMPTNLEKIAVYDEATGEWKGEATVQSQPEDTSELKNEDAGQEKLEGNLEVFTKKEILDAMQHYAPSVEFK